MLIFFTQTGSPKLHLLADFLKDIAAKCRSKSDSDVFITEPHGGQVAGL